MANESVWVFNCAPSMFPGGIFRSVEDAETWINQHGLSGVLTEYPVGVGVYDWAIANEYFRPKKPHEFSAKFIAGFSTDSQRHMHYIGGLRRSEDTLDILPADEDIP